MVLLRCPICNQRRSFFKSLCHECQKLFDVVHENLGKVGLGALMDELIKTGVDKKKIHHFLKSDPQGKGSIMDQITAQLTNNLAAGMGVKETDMTAEDVKKIREHPVYGATDKPLDD